MKSDVTKIRMRTTSVARAMIIEAAELRGMSISKFVVQAAVKHANETLGAQENYKTLSQMNSELFAFLDDRDRQRRKRKGSEIKFADKEVCSLW